MVEMKTRTCRGFFATCPRRCPSSLATHLAPATRQGGFWGKTEVWLDGKASGKQAAWGHPRATLCKVAQSSQASRSEGTLAWLLGGPLSETTPSEETQGPLCQEQAP